MKIFTYNIATFCLAILLVGLMSFQNINAQAPCDDPDYYLAVASNPPNCFGESTGNATVASSKCPCQDSGCNWEWSYDGVILEEDKFNYKTVDGLKAGVYTVSVYHDDDDLYPGCVLTTEVIVPEAAKFIDNIDVKNIACKGDQSGGSINIVPVPEYVGLLAYDWSTGNTGSEVSDLAPGDYSVTVTQFNGCSVVENFTIAEPEFALDFTIESKAACAGEDNGFVEVIAIGGTPPYSYQCDGVDSEAERMENIASGAHQISVIDANGCILEKTVEIEQIQILVPEITTSAEPSICEGGSLTLSSFNNSGVTSDWSPKEGITNPNSNLVTVSPMETTEYTLTVTSQDGSCQSQNTVTVVVNKCETGIFDISQNKLNVFPNPTQSDVFLDLGDLNTNANLNLIDITGKTILSLQSVPSKLELSDLPNGIYYLHISNDELQVVEKIIKN